MLNLTLTLTAQEWIKLRYAAHPAFPNEMLSRVKITRRFALTRTCLQGTACGGCRMPFPGWRAKPRKPSGSSRSASSQD